MEVRRGHGQPACHRAAVIRAQLIDVGMDAAIVGREIDVGLQERAVGLVQLACFHDGLGNRMLARIKE